MEVLIILVPVSLGLSALALGAFLWTLRHAQYEDLEGDAWRILLEESDVNSNENRGGGQTVDGNKPDADDSN